jgi:SET domain-containing protein
MANNKYTVGKSHIEGRGVFAATALKKGDFIGYIKGPIRHKVNKTTSEVLDIRAADWVGYKKNYWTDPLPPFKYLNHCCEATAGIKGRCSLYAVVDILPGEEITIDYSTTEADERWYLNCLCGAKTCRKKIRSIQSLSPKIFKRYFPFIPTKLRELYGTL